MTTKIVIEGVVAGLNGSNGLIRQHWAKARKVKEEYQCIIASQTNNKHKGRVKIYYVGYKTHLMDWDNFCASFKHLGDALLKQKVIKDDKPEIVVSFIPTQIKCRRIDQRVEITIEDV